MDPRLAAFRAAFVRIDTEDSVPVGAGFLISQEDVLTCAHVVAAALRDDAIQAQAEIPQGVVHLSFHFLRDQPSRRASVIHWQPRGGTETNPSGDIAVLRLTERPPDESYILHLTATNEHELFGNEFRAHGFPRDTNSGVWAYGVVRDSLGNGWLQVEDTKEQGRRIEQGFSGGPVQDLETGRFVGMVAASSEYIKAAKVGYVIPAGMLAHACPQVTLDQFEMEAAMRHGRWIERVPYLREPERSKGNEGSVTEREIVIVSRLATYLEDKRLLTDDEGYISHNPNHLRLSAQGIRRRVNEALQELGRDSRLIPTLKKMQTAARQFQEATEGATSKAPMKLEEFYKSLEEYRQEIAEGLIEAANLCDFEIDESVMRAFNESQERTRLWREGIQ